MKTLICLILIVTGLYSMGFKIEPLKQTEFKVDLNPQKLLDDQAFKIIQDTKNQIKDSINQVIGSIQRGNQ